MLPWSTDLAGRLHHDTIESELLRGNPLGDPHVRPIWVYTPPGYEDSGTTRYPAIYVIQGYTGEICVNDMGYPYESFKKGTEAVMELVNGKCDVVVLDSATAIKYVNDNEGLKIVEDPSAFESEEYAIAVAKGNTELLNKINTVLEKMINDGTISELGAKYSEMG